MRGVVGWDGWDGVGNWAPAPACQPTFRVACNLSQFVPDPRSRTAAGPPLALTSHPPAPAPAPAAPSLQSGSDNVCFAFSENQCAGLCRSEQRLEGIYKDCVADPYNAGEWGSQGRGQQAAGLGAAGSRQQDRAQEAAGEWGSR
jgi:hypothetical protein